MEKGWDDHLPIKSHSEVFGLRLQDIYIILLFMLAAVLCSIRSKWLEKFITELKGSTG